MIDDGEVEIAPEMTWENSAKLGPSRDDDH
jgi:hypothetical protein